VWAELGRAELGLGRALGLPLGSVVELDREADAPVDLYVNGLRFAQGHLIVTDDGEWAFQCDAVGGRAAVDASRAAAALAFAPEVPAATAGEPVADRLAVEAPADTATVQDLSAAEIPADTPEAVTAVETPAAPSTPNEEGAVT
jgi:Type III flagellar switch regulator (C-ring) FliN C-term